MLTYYQPHLKKTSYMSMDTVMNMHHKLIAILLVALKAMLCLIVLIRKITITTAGRNALTFITAEMLVQAVYVRTRLAPVLKKFFHQCVISYTCS